MRKFACLFPGQGSQAVGMADPLLKDPFSAEVFREADEVLGFDLTKLMTEGPEEELTLTANAQPAILATSFAAWKVFVRTLSLDAMPSYVAGHSLGEFSALAAATSLDLKDALKLVHIRGKLMQEAAPEGEGLMAALMGKDSAIAKLIEEARGNDVLDIANYNAPGQTVISGTSAAVTRAAKMAKDFNIKRVVLLRVSAPFHSSLMAPVREKFAEELKGVKFIAPFCPVIHNVTAWPNSDPQKMPGFLAKQIDSPVRWVETIQFMLEHEIEVFIEIGRGNILQGLVKKIAGSDFKGAICGFSSDEDAGNVCELMK